MSNKIRIAAVAKKTTLGKSTIWLWVKEDRFPKPFKLSPRVTVWDELEVDKWILERKNAQECKIA
jgi:prophage regulatory protein